MDNEKMGKAGLKKKQKTKNSSFKKLSRMKKDHGNGLINLKDFEGFKQ